MHDAPMNFSQYQAAIAQRTATCTETLDTFLKRVEEKKELNAFLHTYPKQAHTQAAHVAEKLTQGKAGSLAGMYIGLKDLFCYKDHPVSAGSHMLEDFVSQITATSVQRLLDRDAIILGHQNCDEFAMGASNAHSAYGKTTHPLDASYSPGGSSGGGAAAVAANLCHVALGTDTGGSVRQPAAWCGIVGLKPTYGRISRYGVIEFASSFDTVSIFSHTIEDCARVLHAIAGEDPLDTTSASEPVPAYPDLLSYKKKAKIAYIKEAVDHPALDPHVRKNTLDQLERLKKAGHTLERIDFPLLAYGLPTYYTLTTAEASANLARYDGVRYGQRSKKVDNLEQMYTKTRTEMFGHEVKRRILLGTFVLSSGYYDAYYTQAQKVRHMIKKELEAILDTYDFIVLPTTPTPAMKFDQVGTDYMVEHLADLYTVLAPIAGVPAISIPNGTTPDGWPIGFQIIGKAFDEAQLLAFSHHAMAL